MFSQQELRTIQSIENALDILVAPDWYTDVQYIDSVRARYTAGNLNELAEEVEATLTLSIEMEATLIHETPYSL